MKRESTAVASPAEKNRLALVTGSTGLLGRAICHRLAREGFDLCLGYARSGEAAEQLAEELAASSGVTCSTLGFDVTSAKDVQAAVGQLVESRGRVDVLVAAHGVAPLALLRFTREDDIQNAFRINAEGTVHCVSAVLPVMQRQNWGRIVILSSAAAEGRTGQAVYAASKSALRGLIQSAAREYAAYGVTLNSVAPAVVEGNPATQSDQREKLLSDYPLGRFVTPDEVAAATAFLVSDEAATMTGQNLIIDGGRF
ncbi:MAG: SDR family NAD(P)-dependent oxidoreductase [Planctomycetota bacterium]|nr:MAG: SDR family NAD(P)-dependent oxidoreductase [Planctomycetota bacterium]REK22896.1 MAG: SDR family NAD(P)-dependent oxidoreductase [Planctomycetota bacterium]REK37404.1 MAG: SDR family NAD(P)-dependent oxidoreductase [Planctomycetota bacterium]